MSNYTKATNFTAKDSLTTGDPGKLIKGSEIDAEYSAIATAITSKADTASPTFTGTPSAPNASFGTDSTQIATTAFVQAALAAIYPVGSIYTNATNSTNPGTLLGFGTWTAFGAGRVPVGYNSGDTDFDTAEETGGSKTSTGTVSLSGTSGSTALTEAQMPKHYHEMLGPGFTTGYPQDDNGGSGTYFGGTPDDTGHKYGTWSTGGGAASGSETTGTGDGSGHTHSVSLSGSTSSINTLQPYITVYMWKRTA